MKTLEQIQQEILTMDRFLKPIRPVSKKRARELAKYRRGKEKLMAGKWCARCHSVDNLERHHLKGRTGSLLCDTKWMMVLCRACHEWVGNNPAKAREAKLLAPIGQWNSTDKTKHRRRE